MTISIFLQIQGTAVGTRMAPSYPNIFMGKREKTFLSNIGKKPTVWLRYIDDGFVIWPHGQESLIDFIDKIYCSHPTIKFTAQWSPSSVTFLDTKIAIEEGQLISDLYTKPTDTHQYFIAAAVIHHTV